MRGGQRERGAAGFAHQPEPIQAEVTSQRAEAITLTESLGGYWSRRITDEHRLVYTVRGENLVIVQAGYHY
jgi:Txe/YoeB family toxin of Txe-Axe toxin-antitoxin module